MRTLRKLFSYAHTSLPKATLKPREVLPLCPAAVNRAVLVAPALKRWVSALQRNHHEVSIEYFEPDEGQYHRLKSSFPQVSVHKGIPGHQPGADSYIHLLDREGAAVHRLNGKKDHANFLVQTQPLDDLAKDWAHLDLIVVDRGFSVSELLEGGYRTLARCRPVVAFGLTAFTTRAQIESAWSLFAQLGYDIYSLKESDHGICEIEQVKPHQPAHFMAHPK